MKINKYNKKEYHPIQYLRAKEEDFIDKLKNLYYNRELLVKEREKVDAFVKEYSWEETVKKIIEFISEKKEK